jgi:hypothetical protein
VIDADPGFRRTPSGLYLAGGLGDRLQDRFDESFWGIVNRLLAEELGTVTASGVYGLTLEKMLIDTAGQSLEAETHKVLMVTDTEAPDFNLHDFRADIAAEVTGTGYTAGGNAITGTEITLAAGLLTFDGADVDWPNSTIANAMAAVGYFNVGTAATDQLVWLSDFVTAASSTAALFRVQWHANGIITIDYTP